MKAHCLRRLCMLAFMTMTISGAAYAARFAHEDPSKWPGVWYRVAFDENGTRVLGDGDGYGWYRYLGTDGMHRMWFYNGPYDPARKAELEYHIYIESRDPNLMGSATLTYSWTTPQWSALGLDHPPLPSNVPDAQTEAQYMRTEHLYVIPGGFFQTIEPIAPKTIEGYNPEWISIDITGTNIYVFRGVFHDCVGGEPGTQTGACCNRQTGDCFISTAEECQSPYVWLGAGTSCTQCTVSPSPSPSPGSLDFGDAPDPPYATLRARDGARHVIVEGVYLGQGVDGESDGQPSNSATGDDSGGSDDEDGVVFASTLWPGQSTSVQVTASTFGYLNAWVDFDGDGSFDDNTEQIFSDKLLMSGVNELSFDVPLGIALGETFARFRFNTRGLLTSVGQADDGEVEDYKVSIAQHYAPQPGSGKGAVRWSQVPQRLDEQTPYVFDAWNELSDMHLRQMAADDWECDDNRPITGFHWWGSFEDWTQSLLPSVQPLAFHIGIWTDEPDRFPLNSNTFGHPDTLMWETYCTSWTWNVAGADVDPRGLRQDETCFQFTCLLSQDQWFHPAADAQTSPTVYWVSITAVYDTAAPTPQHRWGWTTRDHHFNSDAVQILATSPSSPGSASWPPNIGSRWSDGERVEYPRNVSWDLAFELLTNQGSGSGGGTGVIPGDLAPVYQFWSDRYTSHFYTIDETEKEWLIEKHTEWTYLGIAFYAYPPDAQPTGAVPVYRFYSSKEKRYLYTLDESEKNDLIDNQSKVWAFEGVAWYAFQ